MIDWNSVEKVKTPAEIQHEQDVRVAREYLRETDWYVMRFVETQAPVPEEVSQKRESARQLISEPT